MSRSAFLVRCRPWAGLGVVSARVSVEQDGSVLVWDSVAKHYTRCHSLGASAVRRIRRMVVAS